MKESGKSSLGFGFYFSIALMYLGGVLVCWHFYNAELETLLDAWGDAKFRVGWALILVGLISEVGRDVSYIRGGSLKKV